MMEVRHLETPLEVRHPTPRRVPKGTGAGVRGVARHPPTTVFGPSRMLERHG